MFYIIIEQSLTRGTSGQDLIRTKITAYAKNKKA